MTKDYAHMSHGELLAEVERLDNLINTPHIDDFLEAVRLEAAHQAERWGSEHDAGKDAEHWLWLVAYLATKATQADRYGDYDKYRHHIVTTAAACLNWHAHLTGYPLNSLAPMRPGTDSTDPTETTDATSETPGRQT